MPSAVYFTTYSDCSLFFYIVTLHRIMRRCRYYNHQVFTFILLLSFLNISSLLCANDFTASQSDTILSLEEITVTSIKQSFDTHATAATMLNAKDAERLNVSAAKSLSEIAPNVYMPDYGSRITSSIYVRGMGTRIDQPVIGMNIDNIPVMDKNNYDFDIADVYRMEILRGPQSTLFGRNTMGGLINIYTLSPFQFQGTRLLVEYSSGNTYKVSASIYHKPSDKLGLSLTGHYYSSDGLFTNTHNGEKCDKEKQGGARFKIQWRPSRNLHIDNTFYFSILRQGGYPYESVDNGEIAYNDTCFYRRSTFNDGLTIKWIAPAFTLSSITSFQYIDDNMTLDQDFLPLSYFTLTQARKQHTITQDLIFKGKESSNYNWLAGAFAFYKHLDMNAPVTFKDYGIEQLIEKNRNEAIPDYPIAWDTRDFLLSSRFTIPNYGLALYHQSSYKLNNFTFSAGIRLDYEHTALTYHSSCDTGYSTISASDGSTYSHTDVKINDTDKLSKSYLQILPKISVTYSFGAQNRSSAYLSAAKGYKAGGFNTQMFSDVLQQRIMGIMGLSKSYEIDEVVGYKPEQSWNFEAGIHWESNSSNIIADASIFYIDCNDQQLTRFPDGNTTGRIMTNAGHARSFGAEAAVRYSPVKNLMLNASYGYTNAKFITYNNGKQDFAGKYIPYSPANTIYAGISYSIPTNLKWLENITISASTRGAGEIYWDEENTISQAFYATAGASIRFENKNCSLDLWGQNLTDTDFKTFYFVSIGNKFLQRGKPRTLGATIRVKI